ncbi:DUF3990 domain-containing protein [Paenibacillus sp. NPDC058071]|uniref:DUF3990 domain-containing protein n=1 Tax=Paenibacillus sp. NPDC058071 TaxID=3346326 RepID=UPI0036DA7B8C
MYTTRFVLPDVLYHGTTLGAVLDPDGFRKQLINESFMASNVRCNNRDFGTGLYTTIDFRQAADWARKSYVAAWRAGIALPAERMPVVMRLKYSPPEETQQSEPVRVLDFRGECAEWSDFILTHRYGSRLHDCQCRSLFGSEHPQIVCGPMADNDTGKVIAAFKASGKDYGADADRRWFRDQITQAEDGFRRTGLELGDQIAWFGKAMNDFLTYDGYYRFNEQRFLGDRIDERNYREEWDYDDE